MKKALARLREEKAEFIKEISNSGGISRDRLILQDYKTLLNNSTEWWAKKPERDPGEGRSEKQKVEVSSRRTLAIGEILKAIKDDPNQKVFLISQFLKRFPAISGADRGVILENLKVLPLNKLKVELENLEQLFTL